MGNVMAAGVRRVAAILLMLAMAAVAAQDGEAARTYTVGVEDLQYYPLHTIVNGKTFGGYAREVLDAFAKDRGYIFRYVPLPVNRLYLVFLKDQTLDFKYPDNPKWKSELRGAAKIRYSAVLVTSQEGAMVLPKNKGHALGQVRTLGTVLGFTPWPYLTAIDSKALSLSTAPEFEGLLRHALADHLDAVYVNIDVANYLLEERLNAPGGLVFDPGLPHARSDFSLSTVRQPEVLTEFDAFLRREPQLLQKLKARYKIEGR